MKKSNILIRAEGGKEIGIGHIMRMMVLAKELSEKFRVIFVSKINSLDYGEYGLGIEKIKENGFLIEVIEKDCFLNKLIKLKEKYDPVAFITDSYDVDEEYFSVVNNQFKNSVYIDDLNIIDSKSKIVINLNAHAEIYDYSKVKSKTYVGGKYCLLREEFRNKKISKDRNGMLITVGGSDKNNITDRILQVVLNYEIKKTVIVGKAFNKEFVNQMYKKYKNRKDVIFVEDPKSMSALIDSSEVAISASGSTMYELAALKVPALGVVVADNQMELGDYLKNKNCILFGKRLIEDNLNEFKKNVDILINSNECRKRLIENFEVLIDKNGAKNLKEVLENEINKSNRKR